MIESGYMQIRWYQQSSQGMKPAISEKKRLPPVAIDETRKAAESSYPQIAARTSSRGFADSETGERDRRCVAEGDHLAGDAEHGKSDYHMVRHG